MNASVGGASTRTWPVRVLAVLSAVGLLYFPGLGLVDLVAAVVGLPEQDELVSMRAAYGLVVGFLLPAALLLVAVRPSAAVAAGLQVLTTAAAFLITAAASGLWTAMVGGGGLLALAAALAWLAPKNVVSAAPVVDRPVLALASVGTIPWLVYAGMMASRQRSGTEPYEDFTLGVQGWSALSLFALVMVLNSMLVAFRPPGWRATVVMTGVASLLLGLVGMWADEVPGSLGRAGGAAAVLWGAALATSAWLPWRMPTG